MTFSGQRYKVQTLIGVILLLVDRKRIITSFLGDAANLGIGESKNYCHSPM